jgi:hypothetical protein
LIPNTWRLNMTTTMATCTGPGSKLVKSDTGQSYLKVECSTCRTFHDAPTAHQRASAGLEAEVRAELRKPANRNVVAAVFSDGTVKSYVAPRPPVVPEQPRTVAEKFEASRPYGSPSTSKAGVPNRARTAK